MCYYGLCCTVMCVQGLVFNFDFYFKCQTKRSILIKHIPQIIQVFVYFLFEVLSFQLKTCKKCLRFVSKLAECNAVNTIDQPLFFYSISFVHFHLKTFVFGICDTIHNTLLEQSKTNIIHRTVSLYSMYLKLFSNKAIRKYIS